MDRFSFLGSVHIGFIDDLYEKYLKDPDSIEPSWRSFFQGYDFSREVYGDDPMGAVDSQALDDVRREFLVLDLIQGYRSRGHLFTETNPVRARRKYSPTLDIQNFGLEEADMDREFMAATEVGLPGPAKLSVIVKHLQNMYCRSIGVEYMYIRNPEVTNWVKSWLHQNENSTVFNQDEKVRILHKLNEAVAFESFLNTKFVGQKRFSIEGAESLIPAMEFTIDYAAQGGVEEFVVGMAHRGRLNVLSNIFGKPRKQIFSEFEGKAFVEDEFDGDVKYHLGYSTTKQLAGHEVKLNLAPNPSHLEAVDPVVEGIARAKINNDYNGDQSKVMPILIHGDAAVAAQGVVYEVIQMEGLSGYATGGTLHIVINNQVGFTTNYLDARSSTYCTDIAKVILAPVLHVNGDDPEALVHAMRFAVEYRQKFNKDVFIDLLCYRKYGHNEGDEPRFTQPLLYKEISRHPNPREIYSKKLMEFHDLQESVLTEMEKEFKAMLEEDFDESKKIEKNFITPFMESDWSEYRQSVPEDFELSPETGLKVETLKKIAETITTLPNDLKFINKIKRLFKDRNAQVFERNSLDWGMGELMAYGSLIVEGFNVRISGEDVERGTFSHRHAIVKVEDSEQRVCRLDEIPGREGRFAIYNSLLSEYAVLGFDYGYAMASPKTLTIWEAQFGDFANGAQIIIDQFLAAAEDKWKVQNGLVMLLPHGYEGQGAEHSSARLERFLQLCAQYNMQVANITTPANFYHALRRQMHRPFRKPLVVMSPKSLLRHPKVVSSLEEFSSGRFQEVIDDTQIDAKKAEKVVFVSGKLYYDLLAEREERNDETTALVRLEQLYPLPEKQIKDVLAKYAHIDKKIWAQEEPANMGAWTHILWRFPERLELCAPAASAAPAAGSSKTAHARHRQLIESVFNA
ncbi:2-oxoglutarate dehydrogenase E1 component [Phaeocystidibacter marisrubri]|uniref:oxoglutarate dehydrogenase (succinyl-transferring) n=1 Tax=Phaeocystidibacter marisrubri TaxID=1577780 RepID=A0A6L3ZC48_9FLAO|nr:2-oxoglutarate dehydrogenase E1 component [Phaeocystidibacter marisrubri]KAB2815212.1 2-oxoglutarate dehydrogenase E1 component [Phaeocystidibacter marisrubri]GGH70910.1 2-oxoglutarate dehydrogenase subunit E1 [Phaeocystidibacter marisrubri]